ncbi:MAG: signal peptidase II [Clostridiales bacterium]|jgi:signal peptidase II|nr:signal peptidase II [Clostridiales bacterium]MDR2749210.1 signal peptidase II [Clostridiales bacterium]
MFVFLPILFVALLVAADQFTKSLAVRYLLPVDSLPFVPGLFDFTYVENQGAAYGLLEGGRWFFLIITAVVMVFIGYFYFKPPSSKTKLSRAAMVVIFAGALGNAVDRLRNGYVVDFIHTLFINFPVFNVADICVVCGTILLAILVVFYGDKPATK